MMANTDAKTINALYHIKTVVPEFEGHRDVWINWFVESRTNPVERTYAELIEGYDPAEDYHYYSEGAIEELFSAAEADAFVRWLKDNREATEDTTVDEVALPLARNRIGLSAIPLGGPQDSLCMDTSSLGFLVQGYYDLRGHEPIDKSVPARHQFPSIFLIEGRMVTDYAELLELWRAGVIMANDEFFDA
jgi:hypothetical protein